MLGLQVIASDILIFILFAIPRCIVFFLDELRSNSKTGGGFVYRLSQRRKIIIHV